MASHTTRSTIFFHHGFKSSIDGTKSRTLQGADINRDHYLVTMTVKLKLKQNLPSHGSRLKFNLEKLKDPEVADVCETTITGKFAGSFFRKQERPPIAGFAALCPYANWSVARRLVVFRWPANDFLAIFLLIIATDRHTSCVMCVSGDGRGACVGLRSLSRSDASIRNRPKSRIKRRRRNSMICLTKRRNTNNRKHSSCEQNASQFLFASQWTLLIFKRNA